MNLFPQRRKRTQTNLPSTQDHLLLREMRDGVAILRDGTMVVAVMVQPVDFDLMDPGEREVRLMQYQAFVTSLRFRRQIVLATAPQNLDAYFAWLDDMIEERQKERREDLATLLAHRRQFLQEAVLRAAPITRTFYVIVPFNPISLADAAKRGGKIALTPELYEQGREELMQMAQKVIQGLRSLGCGASLLNGDQYTTLLFTFYHPDVPEPKALAADSLVATFQDAGA